MTGYKRGDLVLAIFPNSDRLTFKKRPVLVLQNESIQTYFSQTIVAPITSNQGRVSPAMLPVRVGSPEHKAMGLLTDSVINLETLTTLEPREIARKIGACGPLLDFDPPLRVLLGL
jgi:mRNA interferase MazF